MKILKQIYFTTFNNTSVHTYVENIPPHESKYIAHIHRSSTYTHQHTHTHISCLRNALYVDCSRPLVVRRSFINLRVGVASRRGLMVRVISSPTRRDDGTVCVTVRVHQVTERSTIAGRRSDGTPQIAATKSFLDLRRRLDRR